jgi:tRNA (cmo5U34)-methyltransferase
VEDNTIDFNLLASDSEAHIFKSVPFHSTFLRTVALLASAVVRPGTICVDLGCSTGRLPRLLRRQFGATAPVKILGIDNSPEMIAEARRKDRNQLTYYVCDDIVTRDLPDSAAFISCLFTLQFLEMEARESILAKIHRALEWRGCAVIAEKVLEDDGKKQMTSHYLLNAYKRSMGLTDNEVAAKERAVRSALRPLGRQDNLRLLQARASDRYILSYRHSDGICTSSKRFEYWTAEWGSFRESDFDPRWCANRPVVP